MQQQSRESGPHTADSAPKTVSAGAAGEAAVSSGGPARCLPSPLAQLAGQDHEQACNKASGECADDLTSTTGSARDGSSQISGHKGTP